MIILRKEGIRGLFADKRLKKLSLRFAKLIKKRYSFVQLYVDYEDEVNLPIFVIGLPGGLEIKDEKKFMSEIGSLVEEAGNLQDISQMFLLAVERIGSVEARRV